MIRKKDAYITTYSGLKFHIFNPTVDEVDIRDCAHSLSMTCRFNSHTPRFYSVGSHSLIGAKLIANPFKKQFLTHDFSETYTGDCVTPIKRRLKEFVKMEHKIERVINKKFHVPYPMAPEVKEMDNLMLRMELVYLMNIKRNPDEKFPLTKRQFMKEINKLHKQVERELLAMYKKLDVN
jgi:hypothetical protein